MIHLLIGNTGAGKSTYVLYLKEKTKGIIFSVDQWNKVLFMPDKKETDGIDWFLERIQREESIIMDLILQLADANVDAILDLGFAKYAHRKKFRDFADAHHLQSRSHFLNISKETRLNRVMKRNQEKGNTYQFEVTKENFDFMESWFEQPNTEEMEGGVVISK